MNHRTLKMLAACCALGASCPAAADAINPLTGYYYGTATIIEPASLGTIDLAFYLDVTGSAIQNGTSFIDLEKTLVFPAVPPQLGGQDVGPRVSGTLSAASFNLTSDSFQSTVSNKTTIRQIVLNNATVRNGGASLSGAYTETVTGLAPDPFTITGTFLLVKPLPVTAASGQDSNGDGCLDLTEIRAGGADPGAIEFSDLSAALNLYYNPAPSLRVGVPPGPTCSNSEQTLQNALTEYYGSQP